MGTKLKQIKKGTKLVFFNKNGDQRHNLTYLKIYVLES